MRILHIIPGLSESYGGPSKIAIEMSTQLQKYDLTSELASTDADVHGNIPVPLNQLINYQGVPTRFFHSPLFQKYGFSPQLMRWLIPNILNYNVVHIHAYFSFVLLIAFWCKLSCVRFIVRPFGQLDPWTFTKRSMLKRAYFMLVGKQALRYASAIHVTSQKEYENLTQLGFGEKCVVIPHGVNCPSTSEFSRAKTCSDLVPNILFLSRIDEIKGLPILIKAIHILATQGLKFSVVIAGAGDKNYENKIKKLVTELSLDGIVSFIGHVKGIQKEQCFVQADIFVLPSYSENFGVVVTEAMSYSLPVILTEGVALAKDVLEADAGIVVPCGSHKQLANAIRLLILDTERRQELSKNAKRLVNERFDWEQIGRRLVRLYLETSSDADLAHSV